MLLQYTPLWQKDYLDVKAIPHPQVRKHQLSALPLPAQTQGVNSPREGVSLSQARNRRDTHPQTWRFGPKMSPHKQTRLK